MARNAIDKPPQTVKTVRYLGFFIIFVAELHLD